MEAYNNSHQWATETYMIPVSGTNLNLVPPQEINNMGGVVPEYVVDHGLYYPAAANYYGYYCTGFESPTEWDDHHRLAGLDGQELQCSGLTTDGLQYVYYIPGYGYAQAPLNPYNPYIPPPAAIGSDNSFLDTQQYIANSPYCQPVSTPYLPLVVQPGIDVIPTVSQDLLLPNTWGLGNSTPESSVVRNMFPPTSASTTNAIPREALQVATFQSFPAMKSTQGQQAQTASVKHTISQGASAPSSVPQDKSDSASLQASDTFRQRNGSSLSAPLKVDVAPYYSLGGLVPNMQGWATGDNTNPRFQFSGAMSNESGNPDKFGEQNRGPRTSKARSQSTSPIVVKAYTNKAGAVDEHGNIKIYTDQYNRTDLPVTYPNAKFFVIKSYSEDDVHKSIKYNVWSSTPNGNKRLDFAYEDARRISGGNSTLCPIFLFFSVNASGQFCGVAEMVGPVDFHKDMDFWQQDKWSGSFPVKWHIVKDVPNTSFRHIVLENNENKPVTNSRDTQEILYIPGLNMLSIFKYSLLRTSVLDDFAYYEERQRIMHEEKTRLYGRLHENPILPPPSTPSSKVSVTIKMPPKRPESSAQSYDVRRSMGRVTTDVEHMASEAVNGNLNAKMTSTPGKVNITIKAPPKRDERSAAVKENSQPICLDAADASMSNGNVNVKADPVQDVNAASVLKKVQSLTIEGDASTAVELCHSNQSDILAASNSEVDVFTVGSMPIKVNGFGESSQTLTIGSIPIDSKALKKNNPLNTYTSG